jgi:N-methylhydantoinase A
MPYHISVDTGGTFTDLAVSNDRELLGIYKAPTTPKDVVDGVVNALGVAADSIGLPVEDLLSRTSSFVYSTTHSTNAIIEGKTAVTALLVTEGHPDILTYREGGKTDLFNLHMPFPKPYIPRRLTFEVRERITADGQVLVPLDEALLRDALAQLEHMNVEAIAVCLLWSPVNPHHELRAGELIEELLPGMECTLSHRLNPIIREYRRTSSTAIDASLKPLMRRHLEQVHRTLRELGLTIEPLMVAHTSGGVLFLPEIGGAPILTLDSGPALAPIAGKRYLAAEVQERDAIVVDTGGTSFDVSLIRNGDVSYTREKWLGPRWTGNLTGMAAVDTRSIGSGGGSIAWIDSGGLLQVGPASAGADPGPACYGLGGTRPTVTDAALVLGYLNPAFFLGSRLQLQPAAATAAMEAHVAEPLRMSVEHAAAAVIATASEMLRTFIREITIDHGLDPRLCLLIAGGGASGMNIGLIARELGCRRVLIPRTAAAFSAVGGQFADFVGDFSASFATTTRQFDGAGAQAVVDGLHRKIEDFYAEIGRHADADGLERTKEFSVEARYPRQVWELTLPLGAAPKFNGSQTAEALEDTFHRLHEQTYMIREDHQFVECLTWRARGRVVRNKPALTPGDVVESPPETRLAYFDGHGFLPTDVHRGTALGPEMVLAGPAVIEEPDTTIVVLPGSRVAVTATGNYLMEFA